MNKGELILREVKFKAGNGKISMDLARNKINAKNEIKNINKTENLTSKSSNFKSSGIKKHVSELLIYMDDERKDYEFQLGKNPKGARNHIWLNIKAIAALVGLTEKEAWELYKTNK